MSPRSVLVAVLGLVVWSLPSAALAQSDTRTGEQWAFSTTAVFDLPGAWELTRGSGVVVAVIDSGARLDHPDLAPNAWVNFREVPGNGTDDDGNGYVDDVHGVDLTTKAAAQDLSDGHGHGTHVSGIIAAAANGKGVVGVAPEARIMTVKVLTASGGGTTAAVAEGIRYATANGAHIINMSLGGPEPDDHVRQAIVAAAAANVVVICSAGNSARDIDVQPSYPVSFAAANLIGVAATRPELGKQIGDFSNYGRITVPVAAPGEEILSTTNDGLYGLKTGTSMAAPHVAGVTALMRAIAPGLSAADIRATLLANTTRAPLPVGSGYVDALGAVRGAAGRVGITLGQKPEITVLRAQRAGRTTVVQFGVSGALQAITRYRVLLDGRRAAEADPGPSVLTLRMRGRAARGARVLALGAAGPLASARARVTKVPKGKLDIDSGSGVGTG